MKVIEIRLTDEEYRTFHSEVGEIVSLAAYMEVGARIYDAPTYASGVLLEPAVVLTAAEHAFLADETLSAALSRVNAQPQNRRSRERSREVTPAADALD